MEKLVQKFYEKYAAVQTEIVRDFINDIDWTNRVIGIKGSRGVGKTTLVLQYIKQNYAPDNNVLYVSLDNLYFSDNSLYDLADVFYKKGGKLLAIEIGSDNIVSLWMFGFLYQPACPQQEP